MIVDEISDDQRLKDASNTSVLRKNHYRRRTYLPRHATTAQQELCKERKSSVQASMLKFLENDREGIESFKNGLVHRAKGRGTPKKKPRNHRAPTTQKTNRRKKKKIGRGSKAVTPTLSGTTATTATSSSSNGAVATTCRQQRVRAVRHQLDLSIHSHTNGPSPPRAACRTQSAVSLWTTKQQHQETARLERKQMIRERLAGASAELHRYLSTEPTTRRSPEMKSPSKRESKLAQMKHQRANSKDVAPKLSSGPCRGRKEDILASTSVTSGDTSTTRSGSEKRKAAREKLAGHSFKLERTKPTSPSCKLGAPKVEDDMMPGFSSTSADIQPKDERDDEASMGEVVVASSDDPAALCPSVRSIKAVYESSLWSLVHQTQGESVERPDEEKQDSSTDLSMVQDSCTQLSVSKPLHCDATPRPVKRTMSFDCIPHVNESQNSQNSPRRALQRRKSSRRFKTDLNGFLKHLAVLNDLKELMGTTSFVDSPNVEELPGSSALHQKRTRFQQMFQLKCSILNILPNDASHIQQATSDEHKVQQERKQVVMQQYNLEEEDLDFILDHWRLCSELGSEMRWDLIETVVFPESEYNDPRYQPPVLENLETSETDQPSSFVGHTLTIGGNSSGTLGLGDGTSGASVGVGGGEDRYGWKSFGELSFDQSTSAGDSVVVYQQDCRETYQETILDLYEATESQMVDLPPEECQIRRRILVQLLQATSEEEAHLSNLNLHDVSEIVHHVLICQESEAEIQWTMIRDIVFPLGVDEELSTSTPICEGAALSSFVLSPTSTAEDANESFELSAHSREDWGLINDLGTPVANDSFSDFFGLAGMEMETVLNHINVSKESNEEIRWDLIGEILFPGDPLRQSLLSKSSTSCDYHDSASKMDEKQQDLSDVGGEDRFDMALPQKSSQFPSTSDPTKQRARAMLSLSSHDMKLSSHLAIAIVNLDDDSEGGCSFGTASTEFEMAGVVATSELQKSSPPV